MSKNQDDYYNNPFQSNQQEDTRKFNNYINTIGTIGNTGIHNSTNTAGKHKHYFNNDDQIDLLQYSQSIMDISRSSLDDDGLQEAVDEEYKGKGNNRVKQHMDIRDYDNFVMKLINLTVLDVELAHKVSKQGILCIECKIPLFKQDNGVVYDSFKIFNNSDVYQKAELNHCSSHKLKLGEDNFGILANSRIEIYLHYIKDSKNDIIIAKTELDFNKVFLGKDFFYSNVLDLVLVSVRSNDNKKNVSCDGNKNKKNTGTTVGNAKKNPNTNHTNNTKVSASIEISCQLFQSIKTNMQSILNNHTNEENNNRNNINTNTNNNQFVDENNTNNNNADNTNINMNNQQNLNMNQIHPPEQEEILIMFLSIGKIKSTNPINTNTQNNPNNNFYISHKIFPTTDSSSSSIQWEEANPNLCYDYSMPFVVNQQSISLLDNGSFIVELWNKNINNTNNTNNTNNINTNTGTRNISQDESLGIINISLNPIIESLTIGENTLSISPITKSLMPLIIQDGYTDVFNILADTSNNSNTNKISVEVVLAVGTNSQVNNYTRKLNDKREQEFNIKQKIMMEMKISNITNTNRNNALSPVLSNPSNNNNTNNTNTENNENNYNSNIIQSNNPLKSSYSNRLNTNDIMNQDDLHDNINAIMNNKKKLQVNHMMNQNNHNNDNFDVHDILLNNQKEMEYYNKQPVITGHDNTNANNNNNNPYNNNYENPFSTSYNNNNPNKKQLEINSGAHFAINSISKEYNSNNEDSKILKDSKGMQMSKAIFEEFEERGFKKIKDRESKPNTKTINQIKSTYDLTNNNNNDSIMFLRDTERLQIVNNISNIEIIPVSNVNNMNNMKSNLYLYNKSTPFTDVNMNINNSSEEIMSTDPNNLNNNQQPQIHPDNTSNNKLYTFNIVNNPPEKINTQKSELSRHIYKIKLEKIVNMPILKSLKEASINYVFLQSSINTEIITDEIFNTTNINITLNAESKHEILLNLNNEKLKDYINSDLVFSFYADINNMKQEIGRGAISYEDILELRYNQEDNVNNVENQDYALFSNYIFIYGSDKITREGCMIGKMKVNIEYVMSNKVKVMGNPTNTDNIQPLYSVTSSLNPDDKILIEKKTTYNRRIPKFSKLSTKINFFKHEEGFINSIINDITNTNTNTNNNFNITNSFFFFVFDPFGENSTSSYPNTTNTNILRKFYEKHYTCIKESALNAIYNEEYDIFLNLEEGDILDYLKNKSYEVIIIINKNNSSEEELNEDVYEDLYDDYLNTNSTNIIYGKGSFSLSSLISSSENLNLNIPIYNTSSNNSNSTNTNTSILGYIDIEVSLSSCLESDVNYYLANKKKNI